jgi:hypothetical protein
MSRRVNSVAWAPPSNDDWPVTTQIYRVTVRGRFDGLDADTRARLRADQSRHDVVAHGAFSEDGTLTYERNVDFFTFRIQLRQRGEDAHAAVLEEARCRAEFRLEQLGAGWRDLKVQATDMASVWR